MPTIAVHAPELSGETGLTLYLWTVAGTLINSGGDALSESPESSGRFVATVAETPESIAHARIHDAAGVVRDGWLPDGATLIQDTYPGDQTEILDRLGYLMAQEVGACADAGTSGESYTITIDTTTYTVDHTGLDSTGNRGTATLTKS